MYLFHLYFVWVYWKIFFFIFNDVGDMSAFFFVVVVLYQQTPETSFVPYIYGVLMIKAINVFQVYYSRFWLFLICILFCYFIFYTHTHTHIYIYIYCCILCSQTLNFWFLLLLSYIHIYIIQLENNFQLNMYVNLYIYILFNLKKRIIEIYRTVSEKFGCPFKKKIALKEGI